MEWRFFIDLALLSFDFTLLQPFFYKSQYNSFKIVFDL